MKPIIASETIPTTIAVSSSAWGSASNAGQAEVKVNMAATTNDELIADPDRVP